MNKQEKQLLNKIINHKLPDLLMSFYDRRDIKDGGSIGRYFILTDQVILAVKKFKNNLKIFLP